MLPILMFILKTSGLVVKRWRHNRRFVTAEGNGFSGRRDRCYDFLNIFAKIFSEKIGVFDSKQSKILKKIDHNIGF
jgi:hypothetical protein